MRIRFGDIIVNTDRIIECGKNKGGSVYLIYGEAIDDNGNGDKSGYTHIEVGPEADAVFKHFAQLAKRIYPIVGKKEFQIECSCGWTGSQRFTEETTIENARQQAEYLGRGCPQCHQAGNIKILDTPITGAKPE